jgi:hypothetical protein
MAELEVLNPVAQLAAELGEPPPAPKRPGSLQGARVGLYWNRKPGGNFALERVGQLLKERFTVSEADLVHSRRPISGDLVRELKETRDVVVGATAD